MKKTLIFITILVFLLAGTLLFAAGDKEESSKGEIVITIPHYKAGQNVGGKFFLPQVDRFNEKYAGTYKLVIEEIPQDSYMGKIKQLAQQNKLPALIEGMDEKWFFDVIAKNEMSLDLSDWLKSNRAVSDLVIDASLDFVTVNGRVTAFPLTFVRPIGMYYNSTMVNFKKSVGEMSIDEFGKALGDNKMAFMTSENAWTTSLFFTSIVVEEGGAEALKAGSLVGAEITDYTTDLWVRSFTKLQYFLQNHASSNTVGAAYADAANSFMSKSAAGIANGTWMVGDFAAGSEDKWSNGFDGTQAVACVYPGNMAIADDTGATWWIPANISDGEKEAALAFLAFIHSQDELEAFFLVEGGNAPNMKASADYKTKLAANKILSELDKAINSETVFTGFVLDVMPDSVANEDWGRLLPKLIDGSYTPLKFGQELSRKAAAAK